MNNIILIFLFAVLKLTTTSYNDFILIEHIGHSDKPIKTLNIVCKKESVHKQDNLISNSNTESYIVNKKKYTEISRYISNNIKNNKLAPIDYGTFSITISRNNKKIVYPINRTVSIRLLEDLIKITENAKNIELNNDLRTNLNRIKT